MFKKIFLTVLLLGLVFSTSFTQAKVKYTWTKVGDSRFNVWKLNDTFLVEDVEIYNNHLTHGKSFSSLEEIKANQKKLNLKISSVKQWRDGVLVDLQDKLEHVQINLNSGKIFLKMLRDGDKVGITKEETTDTPNIKASQNSNYFFFETEEDIYGIKPLVDGKSVSFTATKLTKDSVNGKTREQIRTKMTEDQILYWFASPYISPNGNYISYFSNKLTQFQDKRSYDASIWLIDTKKGTERHLLSVQSKLISYDWLDDRTIVYLRDRNEDFYLYDVIDNTSTQILKQINLLNYGPDYFIYTKISDDQQIYLYRRKSNTEIALPKLSDKEIISVSLARNNFKLSKDGTKMLMYLGVRDPQQRPAIYLVDLKTGKMSEIVGLREGEVPAFLGEWITNKEIIVYSDHISSMSLNTWILSLE